MNDRMKQIVIYWVDRERWPLKLLVPCDASEGSVHGDFVLFKEREGKGVVVNMNQILYYEILPGTVVDPLEGCSGE